MFGGLFGDQNMNNSYYYVIVIVNVLQHTVKAEKYRKIDSRRHDRIGSYFTIKMTERPECLIF